MTTEQMIEEIIELCYPLYKKHSQGSVEALKLDRKEPVEVDGITFSCWREYVCFKVAEYIKEKCPDAGLRLELNGNNTVIELEIDDVQQQKLNVIMNNFLKERSILRNY